MKVNVLLQNFAEELKFRHNAEHYSPGTIMYSGKTGNTFICVCVNNSHYWIDTLTFYSPGKELVGSNWAPLKRDDSVTFTVE